MLQFPWGHSSVRDYENLFPAMLSSYWRRMANMPNNCRPEGNKGLDIKRITCSWTNRVTLAILSRSFRKLPTEKELLLNRQHTDVPGEWRDGDFVCGTMCEPRLGRLLKKLKIELARDWALSFRDINPKGNEITISEINISLFTASWFPRAETSNRHCQKNV